MHACTCTQGLLADNGVPLSPESGNSFQPSFWAFEGKGIDGETGPIPHLVSLFPGMRDNTPVQSDGNSTAVRTFILCLQCKSITSVWVGNTPRPPDLFWHFSVWRFHYGCPMCNNRIVIILQVTGSLGFIYFMSGAVYRLPWLFF